MKEYLLKCNGWKTFLLLTGITVLIIFAINDLFLSDRLYYQSFGAKLAIDRIAKMIKLSQKWQWVGYILIPILILIRVGFTTICLYIGSFFSELRSPFDKLFKVALLSDFVFVLAGLTKLYILYFFKQVSTIADLQFQPFSLLELFGKGKVDTFLIYPFSLISVFELLYWFALAWLLSFVINRSFIASLKMVALSYGTGLFLWVLSVAFITVSLS